MFNVECDTAERRPGPKALSSPRVNDEATPRNLPERTGKHFCIKCLIEVSADEYLRNDHLCDPCSESENYPLQSTPQEKKER